MGHLLQQKCAHSPLNKRILYSTSVPFTLTTVQVPNLALTHSKRFTVCISYFDRIAGLCTDTIRRWRAQSTVHPPLPLIHRFTLASTPLPPPTFPLGSTQRLSADYTQRQNNNFDSFLWDN
jgi:hypothetical protein